MPTTQPAKPSSTKPAAVPSTPEGPASWLTTQSSQTLAPYIGKASAWRSTSASPIEARKRLMKPARRARRGRHRTKSSPSERTAVASMASSVEATIPRPSGPLKA
jgi:hypothetical protein